MLRFFPLRPCFLQIVFFLALVAEYERNCTAYLKTETDLSQQFFPFLLPILLSDALKLHDDRRLSKAEEDMSPAGEN